MGSDGRNHRHPIQCGYIRRAKKLKREAKMQFNEHFEEFLDQLAGQSKFSLRNYRLRLRGFLLLYGRKQPHELKPGDVNSWHRALQERGYAEATLAGYRQALKSFLRYCCGEKHAASHIRIGEYHSRKSKLPIEGDVNACTAVAIHWLEHTDRPVKIRDAAIWLLAKGSGPRMRELRELRLSDTLTALKRGPDQYGIFRVQSIGKTGETTIHFGQITAWAIRRWIQLRPNCQVDRLFTSTFRNKTKYDPQKRYRPLSRSGIIQSFRRIAIAAGISRPILSHALRHRLGDLITRKHGPKIAAMMLNHKDWKTASTAIAFYHHPDIDDVSRAAASMAESDEVEDEASEMARLFGLHT